MNLKCIQAEYEKRFEKFANDRRRVGFRLVTTQLLAETRITEFNWIPYILATTRHEAASRWYPISEFAPRGQDPRRYFNRKYSHREDLGNEGGDDGWLYRGRGYVQITGKANYRRFGDILDIPLLENPDLALEHEYAYEILVDGMIHGRFTGKKLSQYISGQVKNYTFARQIVNRMDKAWAIATAAEKFESILEHCVD